MLCYVFIGEVLHALGLDGVRDPLIVSRSLAVVFLLEEPLLLSLLLHQVVELLLVEVLIDLVLVVQLLLMQVRSGA